MLMPTLSFCSPHPAHVIKDAGYGYILVSDFQSRESSRGPEVRHPCAFREINIVLNVQILHRKTVQNMSTRFIWECGRGKYKACAFMSLFFRSTPTLPYRFVH